MDKLIKIALLVVLVFFIIICGVWLVFVLQKQEPASTEAPDNNLLIVENVELTINPTDISDPALANDLLALDEQINSLNKSIAFAEQAMVATKASDQTSDKKTLGVSLSTLKSTVENEIDQKVKNFNDLLEQVNLMKKVSNRQQNSLSTAIQNEIDELLSLKEEIGSETNLSAARIDYQTIINSYKTYDSINQQAGILLAADKALEISGSLNIVGGKVQLRISKLDGINATTIKKIFADFSSKTSNAIAKSKTAINEVSLWQ
jgi:hypothetical protein